MKNKKLAKAIAGIRKGALHKDLGVPADKKIPKGKIEASAKGDSKTARRARFALILGRMRGKRKARNK